MNLLTKLGEKFKNIKDDTKKRITATILAGGIALSGLGTVGCNNTNSTNTNNPGSSIQTPGGDNGDSTTPGNQNSGNQGPDYSKYSQILQNVLTDQYYRNLESGEKADSKIGSNRWSYNNPEYMAIPYGFLEDEGFDIDAIKGKDLYAHSGLYTIGNNLFVELRAEIKTDTPFWENTSSYLANYLLKYTLTDQELKEIHALHSSLSPFDKTTYSQAPWFVQELSYLKTPEVVSKQYITLDAIEATESRCNEKRYVSNTNHVTYLGTSQIDDIYYSSTFQTHTTVTTAPKINAQLYTLTFELMVSDGTKNVEGKKVQINNKESSLSLPSKNKEAALASEIQITLLSSYYSLFKSVKDVSIEDVLTK